jgi:putative phosphoesterase
MRILVVSDLHGNRAAIEAVREPHDVCFCLGDLVDYGPEPAACIRWAMANAHHAVRGNHDHGVAQEVPVAGDAGFRYLTRITRPDMWEALDAEERKYLLQLPVTRRVTIGDVRFLLVHATPRDPLDEYLLRDEAAWARRLEGVDADVVCVGHSHMQFKLRAGGKTVINPGSVGLPRDGDPRAAYAIIEDNRIELKRIPYPIEETVASIESSPWPDRAKAMLTHVVRHGRLPLPSNLAEPTSAPDGEA